MTKLILLGAGLFTFLITTSNADTYTIKVTTADQKNFTLTTTKIVDNTTDTFIFVPPAGSDLGTATVNCGAHRTVPWGPTPEGFATYSGGSSGRGGGGGKLNGPTSSGEPQAWGVPGLFSADQSGVHMDADTTPGLRLSFVNTTSGSVAIYTINIPFTGGGITFFGNDTAGYHVGNYDFHIGSFVAAGTNLPAPPQTVPANAER